MQSKQSQLRASEIELAKLENIWEQSQHGLLALQSLTTTDASASKVKYSEKRPQWLETQGELTLIHADVDEQVVADVLSDWTGIPLNSMVENELNLLLNLPTFLGERIIGQDHALDII